MDTMTTTKPMTIKQLLSKKEQGSKQYSDEAKENFERSGLIVFRQQLLIDVKQMPSTDDDNRLIKMSRECLKRNVSCKIMPGELSELGLTRRMVDHYSVNICEVNEQYRLTAEKLGDVAVWHYSPSEWLPTIIGIDAEGNRRAAIACIVEW